MFKSRTPKNIMEYDVDDVYKLVEPGLDHKHRIVKPEVRLQLIKMIYDVLGLTLTPDVALASIAMPQSQLCIAPAGGGKTTWSQAVAVLYKLIYPNPIRPKVKVSGSKILCLVYNRHNIEDIQQRHKQIVNKLRAANINGLNIDDEVNASTMHAFCDFIRRTYVAKLRMTGFSLLDEETESTKIMARAVRVVYKKKAEPEPQVMMQDLVSAYILCKEKMTTPEQEMSSDKFQALDLDPDDIAAIFQQYDRSKATMRKYDYADMLVKIADLLENDPDVLADVQRYFHVVIADEVQDFTPIMWHILKLFVSNGTPLICIGDEDQCIYHFRGASMKDVLKFEENFSEGRVYNLLLNRRCKEVILDEATRVIETNTLRFDKKLIGTKPGGEINTIGYTTIDGQLNHLLSQLERSSPEELHETMCCSRERKHAQLLVDILEENKIIFHSLQHLKPFQHELYRHLVQVLNALELPFDRAAYLNLFKVLPCSRKQLAEVLNYNLAKGKFTTENDHHHFATVDYGNLMNTNGFSSVMLQLVEISKKIKTAPLNSYFSEVYELLDKYFWKFKKETKGDPLDNLFEQRVMKFFDSDLTYPEFYEQMHQRIRFVESNNNAKRGLAISTFHGLKGLEYENVNVMFMEDSIFPNFGLIESKKYNPETEIELKEAETRLWYVAITRAISKLNIYYSETDPSIYIQSYLDHVDKEKEPVVEGSAIVSSPESEFDFDFDDFATNDDFATELEGNSVSTGTSKEIKPVNAFGDLLGEEAQIKPDLGKPVSAMRFSNARKNRLNSMFGKAQSEG